MLVLSVCVVLVATTDGGATPPPQGPPPAPVPATGFYLDAKPPANARQRALGEAFVQDGRIPSILGALTGWIAMPRVIPVHLQTCPQGGSLPAGPNAFYNPNTHEIALCYELFELIYDSYDKLYQGDDHTPGRRGDVRPYLPPGQIVAQTVNSLLFVAMHEVGHALLNEWGSGHSGSQEDAVDEFATFALLAMHKEDAAYNGALAMFLAFPMGKTLAPSGGAFWDTHGFGEQRYANITCLIYGSAPAGHASMVPMQIPAERAATCPSEYQMKKRYWDDQIRPRLLKP
jgi:hypothetical protein